MNRRLQKFFRTLLFSGFLLAFGIFLTGCEAYHAEPHGKESQTDVLSAQKGGPSAEHLLSFFNPLLQEEAEGKPALGSGSYEEYWKSRMRYVAAHESEEYYNRVFRDFNASRNRFGLPPIEVPPYASLSQGAANSVKADAVER